MFIHTHTHVCVWTGRPGMLQSMGSQRARHDWATELNRTEHTHIHIYICVHIHIQLCLTLWNPIDCGTPDSFVQGISQARILEWVAIPFSRGSSQHRDRICVSCISCRWILYHRATGRLNVFTYMKERKKVKLLSCVQLSAALWTVAHHSLSMGFSRQAYWSGLPFPTPGDLLDPGIEPRFPSLQVDSIIWATREFHLYTYTHIYGGVWRN